MANSGELHGVLGLPAPDRTPAAASPSPRPRRRCCASAIANAGDGYAVQLDIDARYNARLQLAPVDANAIAVEVDGVRVQIDLASARRADGITIDWVDDERGRGLVVDNPNAPPPVQSICRRPRPPRAWPPARCAWSTCARPRSARWPRSPVAFDSFDGMASTRCEALPKDTALAFLCHHGGRSQQAAEHFRGLGFREVYNIVGGIDAWADIDAGVPKY